MIFNTVPFIPEKVSILFPTQLCFHDWLVIHSKVSWLPYEYVIIQQTQTQCPYKYMSWGGGGVLRNSGDRDDQMGAKIETKTNT